MRVNVLRPAAVTVFLAATLLVGCANRVPTIDLRPEVKKTNPSAVVFFIDGLDWDVFWQLQREGKLPNITRHFVDGGVQVENAAASLPTITYANSVSFVTGVFPGHHNITGNRWFDRYLLIYQDYVFISTYRQVNREFVPPTIYEMLAKDYTSTISIPVKRGATRQIDNWASMGIAWYFRMNSTINQLSVLRLEEVSETANDLGRWPNFMLTYFPTSDTVQHEFGPKSPQYAQNLINIDEKIGQFFESLRRAGLYDSTYRVLVTDHGVVPTTPEKMFLLQGFLSGMGIENRFEHFGDGKPYEQRASYFNPARAVVVSSGGRCCRLHLRTGEYWFQRPTVDEIDNFAARFADKSKLTPAQWETVQSKTFPQLLADQTGVDLAAVHEGDGVVRVVSRTGVGRITRRIDGGNKGYRYEVVSGSDPLEQDKTPASAALMDGGFYPSRQWLAASAGSARPDVVPQLPELFDGYRAGDVVMFSIPEWSFTAKERGGHGGVLRSEILVPFFIGGGDLPKGGTIPFGRTVDITPTVLGLLGKGERFLTLGPPDGVDLSPQLRAAQPRRQAESCPAIPQAVETAPAKL